MEGNFSKYKSFLAQVYQQLKITVHRLFPFFVSFMVDESTEGLAFALQLFGLY